MIFHASIPADDPERVARVLAELWKTDYFPFVFPESLVVIPGDEQGTIIEVHPRSYEQVPAPVEVGLRINPDASPYNAVHLNIGVRVSEEEIFAIGAREGWITRECDRALFRLVELWVENRFLIECMTEAEAIRYRRFYSTPENWREALRHQKMPLEQYGFATELEEPPAPVAA